MLAPACPYCHIFLSSGVTLVTPREGMTEERLCTGLA